MSSGCEGAELRSLLIANRGEIAVRVIETCRRLGITAVAVCSEADREALHVRRADRAVVIGPAPAGESYLDADRLVEAAKRTGADGVHPGYGFLSENPAFAERCLDEGLVWVGPHPAAMRRMASKIEARRLAASLGVPVIPGRDDVAPDEPWVEAARGVGFPLMIKASAGGGGRGIRIVEQEEALPAAIESARAEARAAFGDDALILERYVREPRHIEVQLLCDRHGNRIHLFERECSIQRRHQKLVEEAPAPRLSEEQRGALYAHALRIAEAIAYDSVGTVEFLVDAQSGALFFLEMNTRLQVEHPVTEAITGLDLVALQIRSARGEPLPLEQSAVSRNGWAIEVRVNAEDPAKDFAPGAGMLHAFHTPAELRVDTGFVAGSRVPPHYDSLLAKAIAHAEDRETARGRLERGLAKTRIGGVTTNLSFLTRVIGHPEFREGRLSTRFLERHADALIPGEGSFPAAAQAALALTVPEPTSGDAHRTPWETLGRWRLLARAGHPERARWFLSQEGGVTEVTVTGSYRVETPSAAVQLGARWVRPGELEIEREGIVERLFVERSGDRIHVVMGDQRGEFRIAAPEEVWSRSAGAGAGDAMNVAAPFPGLVSEVRVRPGDAVVEGDVVVVIEAMKMMHNLCATGAAVVAEVRCQPGSSVEGGQVLVVFEHE